VAAEILLCASQAMWLHAVYAGQVTVSKRQGMKTTALLTRMDSPVGNTVGHALEVAEAVDCLHGNGPRPLVDLTATLGQLITDDS